MDIMKTASFFIAFIGILLMSVFAIAQVASGTPIPVPGEAAVGFLEKILLYIPKEGSAVVLLAGVLDFGFRLVKTEQPLSIAWVFSTILHLLGSILEVIASLMDKVLPQRIKKE